MIILIDIEKAFHKIEHSFMTKTFSKQGREDNLSNLIKDIYKENPELTS